MYACVFGSFAAGTTHKGSDIDMLVLSTEGSEQFAIMPELSKVDTNIEREVKPEFYSLFEFNGKLESGDPIALSIAANQRIVLKGRTPVAASGAQ